ncbi:MAG: ArsR/SmtB family transcription factor [Puniceicoccaceae bacterium]
MNEVAKIESTRSMNEEDLARYLWTIGDVTRLRILELLPTTPDCCQGKNVSQLAEELELCQSTISNHLARLRTLGIVRHTKQCRDVYYWIDPEKSEEIAAALGEALKLSAKS